MADFSAADLRGARFDRADLTGAQFFASDFSDARFRGADLTRVSMRGVELVDVDIDGEIMNVTINGVDIGPLVEAELDRRHPDRSRCARKRWPGSARRGRSSGGSGPDGGAGPSPAAGVAARVRRWRVVVHRDAPPPGLRHRRLGQPGDRRRAFPLAPARPAMGRGGDIPGVPRDRDVRPSLDVVLELRRDRRSTVAALLAALTDQSLNANTTPVEGPGWPRPAAVSRCASACSSSSTRSGSHRQFAQRDLAVLESRAA